MDQMQFRVIPGYENYGVTENGVIKSFVRDLILCQYLLNGYLIVDTFRGSATETLPVHRAVALAWVVNPEPLVNTIVNHKDGNPLNNRWKNLEWTTHSGNNYHAVNTGLRKDNIRCRVRDFSSGQVTDFSSMAQAAVFMGLSKDAPIAQLLLKKFGSLINGRFEFKYADDSTPWFYEGRKELVPASRYMVVVKEPSGDTREIFSNRNFLKEFQLYDCPYGKSIPALAQYGNEKYPDYEFSVRDSYLEFRHRVLRTTSKSERLTVSATNGVEVRNFNSLTQCAEHFKVDRSSIKSRLNNGKVLDGWTFTQ